ncbi:hypothetical protein [Caulobacter sp. DWR1-3-2b1]|uniref:hypothetical protein n=1 Tax=Caulobacter sp. DWR1-3-2b1 TaxID=2804670 RepID=UPI003CEC69F4
MQTAYLPPDPPTGHGPHLYALQIFAFYRKLDFDHPPGRKAVVEAMIGHVLAEAWSAHTSGSERAEGCPAG